MVQLVNLYQQEDVSTAELKHTHAPCRAKAVMLNGNLASSLDFLLSKQTLFSARFATKEPSESIGTITSKQQCIVHGVRVCRRNTDNLSNTLFIIKLFTYKLLI